LSIRALSGETEVTIFLNRGPTMPIDTTVAGQKGFQRMIDARIEEYAKRVQDGSTDIFAEKLPDSCYPTKQELEFWVEYVID